ncbi:MAG: metalloregulator ArsR/SmtB family transcription factor [Patescibacteria group bacterium]
MTSKEDIRLLKCLGEETKYRIIKLLLKGEKCACEIPKIIKRTQSNTSMHLAKLIESDILKSRRDGKKILYSIKDFRVCDVFKALEYKEDKVLKKECCRGACK